MGAEYIFDSASDHGREQVRCLSSLYDGDTKTVLENAGVFAGDTCLEIGAGNGSIAAELAASVGPRGSVVAADLDVGGVATSDSVTVLRHDINDGVPAGGPYDVIHARLVLMHLARRDELLTMLRGALAPGGRLVIGDFGEHLPYAVEAPSEGDATLFERVIRLATTILAPKVGMSLSWAERLPEAMSDVGLTDVQTCRIARACDGGSDGCNLLRSYVLQLLEPLQAVGVSREEIARFEALMSDQHMRVGLYEMIYAWGRNPHGGLA